MTASNYISFSIFTEVVLSKVKDLRSSQERLFRRTLVIKQLFDLYPSSTLTAPQTKPDELILILYS